MCHETDLPFDLESDLERAIACDPAWRSGLGHGEPRPGHPEAEGSVARHVAEVLANVECFYGDSGLRGRLRLIALVHDTFKYQVDPSHRKTGENHHAMRARRFAERYTSDSDLLDVIELHDEAYNAWQKSHRDANWERAEERAQALLDRLGENRVLYLAFYRCDNVTGDKSQEPLRWFEEFAVRRARPDGERR
jgi:hypothetical protein